MGNVYSITFEHPIISLPDSLKFAMIEFQMYTEELNPEIKLVVDVSGRNTGTLWNGFRLSDMTTITNSWEKIHFEYKLEKDFYKAETIKIYILNQTNTAFYIDDFKIDFN